MTTRPLTITTTTHPLAVAIYVAMSFFGLMHVTGLTVTKALTELIGQVGVGVWAGFLLVAPVGCLWAAFLTRRRREVRPTLIFEGVCSALVGILFALYGFALIREYPFGTILGTQDLVAAVTFGSLARASQTWVEVRRLRFAGEHPVQADPPPAGDPTDRG